MKKLDEIPKIHPFKTPDGYFDRLPGIIQDRVLEKRPSNSWFLAWPTVLRYAVPFAILAGLGIFWISRETGTTTIQTELAAIQPDQLAVYLDDHEISTEDLVENVAWSGEDLEQLETEVYSDLDVSHPQLEKIINEDDEL